MGVGSYILDILSNFYGVKGRNELSSRTEARGLGTHIKWVPLDVGLKEAKERGRPIMVVIHKSGCNACKQFKPKIARSSEIARLSSAFIMVNLLDDEELQRDDLMPDGRYVPRIIFLSPYGSVLKTVTNRISKYPEKYFYGSVEELIDSMIQVLKIYPLRCE
ncbi:hypothetical protein O3M35_007511 [Rhynocoris fuscipes]|uniref:Thioredoxin domain-containing protein 12 n=1 Tax=Rhynocoris fuscipes TaxID=488301 RepID=A0AAW1DH29_9HEMI